LGGKSKKKVPYKLNQGEKKEKKGGRKEGRRYGMRTECEVGRRDRLSCGCPEGGGGTDKKKPKVEGNRNFTQKTQEGISGRKIKGFFVGGSGNDKNTREQSQKGKKTRRKRKGKFYQLAVPLWGGGDSGEVDMEGGSGTLSGGEGLAWGVKTKTN